MQVSWIDRKLEVDGKAARLVLSSRPQLVAARESDFLEYPLARIDLDKGTNLSLSLASRLSIIPSI